MKIVLSGRVGLLKFFVTVIQFSQLPAKSQTHPVVVVVIVVLVFTVVVVEVVTTVFVVGAKVLKSGMFSLKPVALLTMILFPKRGKNMFTSARISATMGLVRRRILGGSKEGSGFTVG